MCIFFINVQENDFAGETTQELAKVNVPIFITFGFASLKRPDGFWNLPQRYLGFREIKSSMSRPGHALKSCKLSSYDNDAI